MLGVIVVVAYARDRRVDRYSNDILVLDTNSRVGAGDRGPPLLFELGG